MNAIPEHIPASRSLVEQDKIAIDAKIDIVGIFKDLDEVKSAEKEHTAGAAEVTPEIIARRVEELRASRPEVSTVKADILKVLNPKLLLVKAKISSVRRHSLKPMLYNELVTEYRALKIQIAEVDSGANYDTLHAMWLDTVHDIK